VFVTLDYTPLVYRLSGDRKSIDAHTGATPSTVQRAWIDDGGQVVFETDLGPGVALDRDLPALLEKIAVVDGRPADDESIESVAAGKGPALAIVLGKRRVPLGSISAAEVAQRFGFEPSPRPAPGEREC
jgi:hypothetical protein